MTLFSRYASTFSLLAAVACHDSPVGPATTVIDGNLVRLTTSASTREFASGSPVTLQIRLTNEGSATVTLHFGSSCQILPYIRDFRGAGVIPPEGNGYFCLGVLTQLTLAPGQSELREYVWTGSTSFRSEMPLRPMPPGSYYFTAEVPAYERTLRSEPIELSLK